MMIVRSFEIGLPLINLLTFANASVKMTHLGHEC